MGIPFSYYLNDLGEVYGYRGRTYQKGFRNGDAYITVTQQSLVSGIWQNPLPLAGPVLQ